MLLRKIHIPPKSIFDTLVSVTERGLLPATSFLNTPLLFDVLFGVDGLLRHLLESSDFSELILCDLEVVFLAEYGDG